MKRLLDIVLAGMALVLLAHIIAAVALLVRVKIGRPVLFRQQRLGLNARPFTIVKFRTMLEERAPDGRHLADAERLTPFGRWLRSTSLDELPELWNVLRGDMSMVGPRPLLMHYLPLYTPEQARRHEVRPGLTGWAQINGRNAISWERKFALDVWYVDNRSGLLDLKILVATIVSLFRPQGISAADSATMPEFTGSPKHVDAHDVGDDSARNSVD